MKLELDIPDIFPEETAIRIFRGMELVAFKYPWAEWQVKTGQCSKCGYCCAKAGCKFLGQDGSLRPCSKNLEMPFACAVFVNERPECTQRFEEMKLGNS